MTIHACGTQIEAHDTEFDAFGGDMWREWLHGAHSNETLSYVLVLADQFLPICHLMIQRRDFESKLRDFGFQQET
jgi:hypothetical protein